MKRIIISVTGLFLIGCVSVPANSPELNQKVSDGIIRLQMQHLNTLDKVYELSISKVNSDYDIIYEKALSIFKQKNGADPSSQDEYKIVSIIAAGIRDEIIKRLNENREEIEKEIIKNYEVVVGVNNEITLYLHSAARYAEAREETIQLINKLTGIDLDVNKHFSELDGKLESIIKEETQ